LENTLELLDRLKSTVRTCANRADQLARESSLATSRLDRQIDQEIKDLEFRLSSSIAELDAHLQTRQEGLESRHDRRNSRLLRAHAAARKHHLKVIESREGREINDVQRELLATSRDREAQQKQANAAFANLQNQLADQRDKLTVLERRTRKAFRGYAAFGRLLDTPPGTPGPHFAADESQLQSELGALLTETNRTLRRFRMSPLPFVFSLLPPWPLVLLLLGGHVAAVLVLPRFGVQTFFWQQAGVSLTACLGGEFLLHLLGRLMSERMAGTVATAICRARVLLRTSEHGAAAHYHQELERVRHEAESRTEELNQRWARAVEEAEAMRKAAQRQLEEKWSRASEKNEQLFDRSRECLQQGHDEQAARLNNETEAERRRFEESRNAGRKQFESNQQTQWETLQTEWRVTIQSIYKTFADASAAADRVFPDWRAPVWQTWTVPHEFIAAAPFAHLEVDIEKLAGGALPRDPRLTLPGPVRLSLPLFLIFPDRGSILFETKDSGRDLAIGALNNLVLRLLSVAPPGRVVFTVLDPVGLGQSFAGLMHLTDHEDRLINRRIWTQPEHIEQRLVELNEHIEKVTQLYLRNEFASIAEFNEQAGRIAEPYHFLVVADFPMNFSDLAVRRLLSILGSGPRCGVYTLIHSNQRKPGTVEAGTDDLRKASVCVSSDHGGFVLAGRPFEGTSLLLDPPPDADLATSFLAQVGRCSVDSNRVEMPFDEIAPEDAEMWTLETSAEIRVPIGRTGATKFQYLALGKGTRQHALIAGKTGSGKSTLFHVLITNLALWCSPDQVEFYLVDFKKGVEFKCYGSCRLPHARVVAIESDREFGLSVLERVDEELRRRGDLFRRLGVQDLQGYKRAGGAEPLPRALLIIDEFQEFFVEDDRVSQQAALLLDRLVRQGRAFGIHVLLGSQTLGGAYTLARTTLGQMVVRIALQCNEADSLLIMEDDNPAPRLLSRPGEAIYNDAAGAIEGNSPFQVVWLSEEERASWLNKVRRRAEQAATRHPVPVIFEGNAPAEVRDNSVLQGFLEAAAIQPVRTARGWLGAPNSIKGPTEAHFLRQSGNNLLMIGQRDESALALLGISLISLAAQHPRGTARFVVLDAAAPGSRHREFIEKIVQAVPHEIALAGNAQLGELFVELKDEFARRIESEHTARSPTVYLFIHDIQRFKGLRHEDDFNLSLDDTQSSASPGKQLDQMICEGPPLGFHVLCTCDTANNASRFFSRKTLSEFELRVLFQMSANDSAGLIDSSKAANLGLHRAILYNAQAGTLETFRPYALPDDAWIVEAAGHLSRLLT
jgi:DNA segregation ATPase FtsK/SpoIIIE-like protein